ncbi:hypothetical protein Bca4012_057857 [Brassica carinata]
MARVMNAIFPEERMVLFHRVQFEMEFADYFIANRNRTSQPVREIIEIDADDDEMVDGSRTNVATGVTPAPAGHTQEDVPPILWDVGMTIVDYQANNGGRNTTNTLSTEGQGDAPAADGEGIENDMLFWEALANEEFAPPGELNVDLPTQTQGGGFDIGVIVNNGGRNNTVNLAIQAVAVDNEGGSSTGSADVGLMHGRHQVNMTDNMVVGNAESPMIGADNEGVALASTAAVDSAAGGSQTPLEPMEKLALVCAAKEVGASKAGKRPPETSSEGSTTDGGC